MLLLSVLSTFNLHIPGNQMSYISKIGIAILPYKMSSVCIY